MITGDKLKVRAFIIYADDTEGMQYSIERKGDKFVARPMKGTDYAPECIKAVEDNFRREWKMFN